MSVHKRPTYKELLEKYRLALMGLRSIASDVDDSLTHEILDQTFEWLGESKDLPGKKKTGGDGNG